MAGLASPDIPNEYEEAYDRNKSYVKPGTKSFQTKLTPDQENAFRKWVTTNKVPFDPNSKVNDYDMRGFYQALQNGDEKAKSAIDPNDNRLHYPDTWKTPYHQTFSNESQYATPDAPHWENDKLISKDGTTIFDDAAQRTNMADPINDNSLGYTGGGLLLPVPTPTHPPVPDHGMPSGHFMSGGIMHNPQGQPVAKQDGPVMRRVPQPMLSGGLDGPNPTTQGYAQGGQVNEPDWETAAGDSGGVQPPTLSYASGGPAGGLLSDIPGYGEGNGDFMGSQSPNQKNGWSGTVGGIIGSLIGSYFGGPAGGMAGNMAGKQGGNEFGNVIAGRDAFNGGKGDFWDNLNPLSSDGAASIGQSLNNAQAGTEMPQKMMGGMGGGMGGLPGMGGGLPSIGGGLPGMGGGSPLSALGLKNGGPVSLMSPGYADGGPTDQQPEQQAQQAPSNPNDPNAQTAQNAMPAENKADDIPAKLSKGEFVMDAATVMFFGVGKLQQMQEKAHAAIAEHIKQQQAKQGGQPQQQQTAPQQGLGSPQPQQPQQGAPQQAAQMPAQMPSQAAPQQNATQQRIAQTATPPAAPKPSSPFSLMG